MQPAQLAGTSWQLVELRGGDGGTLRVQAPASYTIAFEPDGTAGLRLDCNRGQGSYLLTPTGFRGGRIEFGPIAGTRAACPPGSLDGRVARELATAQRYRLEDGTLRLELAEAGAQQVWRRGGE
jgi:heat shock protein HslJ